MRSRRAFLVSFAMISLALCHAPALAAQDVLRVETRLVLIDVVVRDGGRFVSDLSPEDFTIYDNGIEQQVALFEVVVAETPASFEPAVNGVTNRVEAPGERTGVTVLLVDQVNADPATQIKARGEVLDFIESADASRQLVAIYSLGREGVEVLQGYTRDRSELRRAASRIEPKQSIELALAGQAGVTGRFGAGGGEVGLDPELEDARRVANEESDIARRALRLDRQAARRFLDRRVAVTAEALDAIAAQLDGFSGRTSLVWLSGSFPFSFDANNYFDSRTEVYDGAAARLERAGRSLIRAGVADYPVDARGLFAFMPPGTETVFAIAEATGGRASVNTNGVTEAMIEAAGDAAARYVLGFYPSDGASDGSFHTLRVEVAGEGRDVRHRRGYYGFGAMESTVAQRRERMQSLILSSLDATAIELASETGVSSAEAGELETWVRIDPGVLDLESIGGSWVGEVDVAWLVAGEGNTRSEVRYNTARIDIADEDLDAARREGVVVLRHIHGSSPGRWLRVAVREWTRDAEGSLWVPLGDAPDGE